MEGPAAVLHGLPVHEVVLVLETNLSDGLSEAEAASRLARFGPNTLPVYREHGAVVQFLLQFRNPLIYVLLGAFVVTLLVGERVDASVIAGVVVINAIVGYVQERRAGEALEALARMTVTTAIAVRGGVTRSIDSRDLVPGDVVVLDSGDRVPADMRIESAHELRIDESSLTGESEPVHKIEATLPAETVLADRLNMAYSGTLVTSGNGRGLVVATGGSTEIGRIHQLVGSTVDTQTPLTRQLAVFGRWLTIVILALAALTFVIGLLRGESAAEMVTAAVALAVGAIPEGLPAAVTIVLAIGVSRMAARRAIIRKLPAAETLGSTTVICTDKTGTLTQNRMAVVAIAIGGTAFDPADAPPDGARECRLTGVLCSRAELSEVDGRVTATGDPTEAALLVSAHAHGVGPGSAAAWEHMDELPFSSETGFMATTHRQRDSGEHRISAKGSIEALLPHCNWQITSDGGTAPLDRQGVNEVAAALGSRGLRVLAFASAVVPEAATLATGLPDDLRLDGLQAMEDPLRPESARAVATCQRAGIRVKMITGDHPHTAAAIAATAGIGGGRASHEVMTGAQLAATSATDLPELVDRVDVFARVSADQKLRIVDALQQRHHVVAMTGDGVNDAPALKQADIGIAMGHGGTEVAKEAAAMVLADDNFATIEAAVEEGRGIYDNLVKFIIWTLPTNIGEGLVILTAIVLGVTLPITPVQILWINMTTAVALGLMLAFEPGEPGIMQRPPRAPGGPILSRHLVNRTILVGALMLIGAFGVYELALHWGAGVDEARTAAVNAFVAMEIAYLFNCRMLDRAAWRAGLLDNRPLILGVAATIVLQVAFTHAPWMQLVFQTTGMQPRLWAVVAAVGVVLFVVVELAKRLIRGPGDPRGAPRPSQPRGGLTPRAPGP